MPDQTPPRVLRFLISLSVTGVAFAAFASKIDWSKIASVIAH